MKIAIIGAGNIGTAMAAKISEDKKNDVCIYSTRAQKWLDIITYIDIRTGEKKKSNKIKVTDKLDKCVSGANIVFVTYPSFLRKDCIDDIAEYCVKGCLVVFVPGGGGIEYFCEGLREKQCIVAGTDRVPCVSRLIQYGESVQIDWKKSVRGSCLFGATTEYVVDLLSKVLQLKCFPLKNYLVITLTPANQIMHPVRLYSLFKYANAETEFEQQIPFYREWDDDTSHILLACDNELQNLCKNLKKLELEEVVPLGVHYESMTPSEMTKKLRSIPSFSNIKTPLKKHDDGKYRIDFESRYFQEDFPYGLCIIKSIAELCHMETPWIDRILCWDENIENKEYFVDGKWCGKDLKSTNIPQVNGIQTLDEFYEVYGQ